MSNYIERCLSGEALVDEIDDYIDEWHETSGNKPLHAFLGMTEKEYSAWLSEPDILPFIVIAHQRQTDLDKVLEDFRRLPIAARSSSPEEAQQLIEWLKRKGKWD